MTLNIELLEKLIFKIGENAHGHSGISELKESLKKAKPHEITSFWKSHGVKEAIT
jgi:hypothetical protein